jgi:hypothetical protein
MDFASTLDKGVLSLMILTLAGPSAHATPVQLITNGNFESYTSSGTYNQVVSSGNGDVVTGWTTTSNYTFLETPALATPSSSNPAVTQTINGPAGALSFWVGSSPTFTTSPVGGNFIAADGAYQTGTLSQSISGLTVGQSYALSFYQAGAQQSGFTSSTTDQWEVTLGSQTNYSQVINDASQGFSGWQQQTMYFTATSTTENLGFYAIGTPSGVPPFALLDGISLVATVPEPAPWAVMVVGLCGVAAARRRFSSRTRDRSRA